MSFNKKVTRRMAFLLLAALLFLCCTAAAQVELHGFDKNLKGEKYQFVTFGQYPYTSVSDVRPVTWRVLVVKDGSAFMITENVIDFTYYHNVKDEYGGPVLEYKDTMINAYCNNECINLLFTKDEQKALIEMEEGRGLLSCAKSEELLDRATGFRANPIGVDKNRWAKGTPFAHAKGLKQADEGHSWYWTATRRRPGYRYIVGSDGHISAAASNREGGLRPAVYLDMSKVDVVSGEGTSKNPFIIRYNGL